jgi:hypothetical protein
VVVVMKDTKQLWAQGKPVVLSHFRKLKFRKVKSVRD